MNERRGMDPETYITRLGQIVAAKKYAHAHAFAAKNHAPLAERFTHDQREAIRALMATVAAAPPPKPITPQGAAIVLRSREDALDLDDRDPDVRPDHDPFQQLSAQYQHPFPP